jgi:hypothetical protein
MDEELRTIAVWQKTKERLDAKKLCDDETYNSEINRLLDKLEEK